jgi:cytochrome c553
MKQGGVAIVAAAALAALPAAAQPQSYAERYAAVCAACHGVQGVSAMALTPSLAGQPSFYAVTQLFLFREGRRDNPLMSAVAKGMSNDDLRGFSDLIGSLPAVLSDALPDSARVARGAALAARYHCAGCHGADYAGGKQVPRLAGQREDYLQVALRGFRAATRLGYTPAMTEALAGTEAADLDDLAHYLATFKP